MIKNRRLIIVCLFLLELCMIFISYKAYLNKPKKNEVKENITEKKSFSMYVEKDGEYKEYNESNLFPSNLKYIFNATESYCIDIKEDIVDNVLSYNNGKVTVTSSKTVYCYLYFDQNKYDLQTNIYVENESGTYTALSEVPTSVTNYNYNVRYECSDNSLVKTFEYDYKNHNYNLITTGKNQCQIYFDEMEPDMSLKIYVDNSEVSEIPEGRYSLNESKSTCSDSNATISYDESTNEIEIISSGITSCTVYLETKTVEYLGEYLLNNTVSGLDKTFVGDETNGYDTLYRFSGTNGNTGINNYVCLGTTSKCASGSDNMYRIIGVEPSTGYVKVIKQIKYGDNIYWDTSGKTWPNSEAYNMMTTWYNSVSFKSMIVSHSWGITDVSSAPTTRANAISSETSGTPTTSYVGMLAVSDYYLAYRRDQNWDSSYSNYTSNWLHLSNNGINENEWTMTHNAGDITWAILTNGRTNYDLTFAYKYALRPTFFLDKTVNRISGSGTSTDPFILGY